MTYYAVTNDPNELMHFGIKGMKWGVLRTPEQLGHHKSTKARTTRTAKPKENKPRSPAYQKASAKLSRAMRAGIAKAQANWAEYNSPYNKAQREYNRALKRDERAYKRNEKAFQKHLQLAREGRLKYKGISDEEVGRITDRLALERSSRLLSGTEKQSFGRRLRERVGEGVIEGVGRGASSYVADRIAARGRAKAEIKAERMKTRAQYTPSGMIHRALDNHIKDSDNERQARRESQRENYKYKHNLQRKDAERKAEQDARDTAEANYLSLVNENRDFGYDSVLPDGSLHKMRIHNYSMDPGHIKGLSSAELKARTSAIENAKKLYNTNMETMLKRKILTGSPNSPTPTPPIPVPPGPRPVPLPPGPTPKGSWVPPWVSPTGSEFSRQHLENEKYNQRLAERQRELSNALRVQNERIAREREAARRKAQNEGYSYYAQRAASRARDEALLRLESNGTGSNIGNPDRQSWRVTRTKTRRRNYR